MDIEINRDRIETLYDNKFLKLYDLRYAEGKHYFEASRRAKEDLVAGLPESGFRDMLPDAVTIAVVLHLPGGRTRLLMSYEYRYPAGRFLLSPVSTPGMTDESNAFLCAELTLDSLDGLSQSGAEGSELFDGFELLDRDRAEQIFRTGRDEHGHFYSLATWMVLSLFLARF